MSLWDILFGGQIVIKKMYVPALCVGLMASFIIMVILNLSPYVRLHYIPEAVELFLAGLICGLMARKDEELFAVSMVLPAMANYVLNALFVPIAMFLAGCFYTGLYLGGKNFE